MANNEKKAPETSVPFDEKELEAAQEEAAKESSSTYAHKLKKPLAYNGATYTELHFDFDTLTGKDSMEVEAEMQRLGKGVVVVPALSSEYMIRIAAKAAQEPIGSDAFLDMCLFDYNSIKDKVRNFLMRSEQ